MHGYLGYLGALSIGACPYNTPLLFRVSSVRFLVVLVSLVWMLLVRGWRALSPVQPVPPAVLNATYEQPL